MASTLTHEGIVRALENNSVRVEIVQTAACAGCKAKSMCGASESMVKYITAEPLEPMQVGDAVVVSVERRLGWRAVLYAFLLPVGLMMLMMGVVFPRFIEAEWLSGTLALLCLVPYYIALHYCEPKFEQQYRFTAQHAQS